MKGENNEKKELIDYLADATRVQKEDVEKVYEAIFELIKQHLVNRNNINIVSFGTFRINTRKARKGIKPSTGETVMIAPHNVVTFKPSPSLKKLVNLSNNDF